MLFVALAAGFGACDVGGSTADAAWQIDLVTRDDGTVAAAGPLRFQLDRRLSSWSVDRGSVRLFSGSVVEFVFPWFDPLTNQLVVDLTRPLLADTAYAAQLTGLVDLDGDALDSPRQILLRAATGEPPPPVEPVTFAPVLSLLQDRCATGGCHDSNVRAAGLVLSDPLGLRETALGVPSLQVDSANAALDPAASGLIELPVVDPSGAPSGVSRSYLIYKVLGDPHALGEPMPPPAEGPLLGGDDLRLLALWIAAGAPLE